MASDSLVPGTSFVSTTSGATMTSENILHALRLAKEKKKEKLTEEK